MDMVKLHRNDHDSRHAARRCSIHATWGGGLSQILRLRFSSRKMTSGVGAQDDVNYWILWPFLLLFPVPYVETLQFRHS